MMVYCYFITIIRDADCILVDEAQFLSSKTIDQFREIVDEMGVPVICYGLRTDFRTQLFEGAKVLHSTQPKLF
jgi:thymidine kinase